MDRTTLAPDGLSATAGAIRPSSGPVPGSASGSKSESVDLEQQMVYAISHDLRGPARHIHTFVDLLRLHFDGEVDEVATGYLDRLGDAADVLEARLDALTRFSRIVTRGVEPRPYRAGDAASTAVDLLAAEIAATGAEVLVAELPIVLVDRDQLVTVFQELIGNTLKFCPPGPSIRITSDLVATEHRITVADDGPGFCQRDAEVAFELFRRFHPASVPGTGAGLAIVERIVQRHGGRVALSADSASGAQVHLFFPARRS
jgi:signal transduction histidine kinase